MKSQEFLEQTAKLKHTRDGWSVFPADGKTIWNGDMDRIPLAAQVLSREDSEFIVYWYQNYDEIVKLVARARTVVEELKNRADEKGEEVKQLVESKKSLNATYHALQDAIHTVLENLQLENGCYDTHCDLFNHSRTCTLLAQLKEKAHEIMEGTTTRKTG